MLVDSEGLVWSVRLEGFELGDMDGFGWVGHPAFFSELVGYSVTLPFDVLVPDCSMWCTSSSHRTLG